MPTIQTKFIICSLPRTGTKSLIQMMKQLGFGTNHAPGPSYDSFLTNRGDVEVMADTPMYQPSVIQSIVDRSDDVKFIYVDKSPDAWVQSILKVGLNSGYESSAKMVADGSASAHNQTDYDAMFEVLNKNVFDPVTAIDSFNEHYAKLKDIIPEDRLLVYNFNQGWEPLCKFTNRLVPESELPHLNKDTMFDPVN